MKRSTHHCRKTSIRRRLVSLVRVFAGENQAYIDQFWYAGACEPEQALRAAVQEFLNTPAGRKADEETSQDFNWGDSIQDVPDRIWRKHGLTPIEAQAGTAVLVDHDEVFQPEEVV